MLSGYAVVCFVTLQIADVTFEPLGIDDVVLRAAIALMLIGVPVVAYLAWMFDVTPDAGIQKKPGGRPLLEAGVTLAALLLFGATVWWLLSPDRQAPATRSDSGPRANTVAVLPFADMSPAGDQAYFANGIAEQILNELAGLEALRVASRTSSFEVAQDRPVSEIGAALGVAYVLEGSVRREGERVRVTAQLIDAATGFNVWSKVFDREFKEIFAIQEEISKTVAGSLGVTFGADVNAFEGAGTQSVDAYESLLQGWTTGNPLLIRRAIDIDPDYAAAWSALGLMTASRMLVTAPESSPALIEEAVGYLSKALELDPNSAQSLSFYGTLRYAQKDWVEGAAFHQRARALSREPSMDFQYGNLLLRAGYIELGLEHHRLAQAQLPASVDMDVMEIEALLCAADFDAAARAIDAYPDGERRAYLELLLALNGSDAQKVRDSLALLEQAGYPVAAFARAAASGAPDELDVVSAVTTAQEDARPWPTKHRDLALLAAYFGAPEVAQSLLYDDLRFTPIRAQTLWLPIMQEVRRLSTFVDLLRELNLPAFYREQGSPDLCELDTDGAIRCR
ncbi:MAG: hypothetical protein AAGI15_05085 [Pseudomonadota bacterium]